MKEVISLYIVKTKEKLMNIKMRPQTHREFKIAAELRGSTMSSLIHQFIVQTIWQEKSAHPEAFADIADEGGKSPAKITNSNTAPTKRDWIEEALDTAYSFGGKPLSEKTREKIRKILEQDQEKPNKE